MTDNIEHPSNLTNISDRFLEAFKGSGVEQVFLKHYSPDIDLRPDHPIYQKVLDMANGDAGKALELFELQLQFGDAVNVIIEEGKAASASIDQILSKTTLLVEFASARKSQILAPETPS